MTPSSVFSPSASERERSARERMNVLLVNSPIPEAELSDQVLLYARRQVVTEVLIAKWLYEKILDVPGVIMELGCRFGSRLALFMSMRGILEPYNAHRRIVGFDTFKGFVAVDDLDGGSAHVRPGHFATPDGYSDHLRDVLDVQSQESPLPHVVRHEIVEGDVCTTIPEWLVKNPEAFVALAYFDLDLFRPTLDGLKALTPRLVKGSILAFDQVGHPEWPGETAAVVQSLGLGNREVRRPHGLAAPTIVVW